MQGDKNLASLYFLEATRARCLLADTMMHTHGGAAAAALVNYLLAYKCGAIPHKEIDTDLLNRWELKVTNYGVEAKPCD